jgi:hypothetical protein
MPRLSKEKREELKGLFAEFEHENGSEPVPALTVAKWAVKTGRISFDERALTEELADSISTALQASGGIDSRGRKYREFHCARQSYFDPETGKTTTQYPWARRTTAPHEFMVVAFTERFDQAIADLAALKQDVDSYNDDVAIPAGRPPIQIRFPEWFHEEGDATAAG